MPRSKATIFILLAAIGLVSITLPGMAAADKVVDPTQAGAASVAAAPVQVVELRGDAGGKRFDGIGVVNGGGATSVLLKDYPEPQRGQILDLVFKPKFGASVSALLVEIPGDGNSTQGSMPSHMHARDDLNYHRGYTWWVLREAKKRNPNLTLDGTAWSAPGWIGKGETWAEGEFWSQDAADYYVKWLQGLRKVYGLEFDALGCRNEKGYSLKFAKTLRRTLDANGFDKVKVHAFDHWPDHKFDFVKELLTDAEARDAIDIIGAHVMYERKPAPPEVQAMAARMNKPIWNTEEHVYKKGFDAAISIVEAFNENFIRSGATKVVNWYDIAGVYPSEPYSEDPAALLAHWPWSGHYRVREALWGYAHYGQFTEVGWQYLNGGHGDLAGGGTFVTLKSPGDDYSVIIETKGAKAPQQLQFKVSGGLSAKELCVWRSNAREQFIRQADIKLANGSFTLTLEPDSMYSLSTTRGQRKGSFDNVPAPKPFPFPYYETFEQYSDPNEWGHLPRYTADIAGAFELVGCPDGKGKCLRQVVPVPTISWAPDWLPYTILGDEGWQDYEVSADVYLNPGEAAAVMGRVNHVGTGYGFIPKGYFLQLGADGGLRLVVVRGKKDKKTPVGDAEQEALIKAGKDEGEGGEKVLATARLPNVGPGRWHNLKLRFQGSAITGLVDGKTVLSATDALYERGMAGLLAAAEKTKLSTPYFDNVLVTGVNASAPRPSTAARSQSPIYGTPDRHKRGPR
jgi:galactosylceramidase